METSSARVTGEARLVSLDGLRGLAALTVLLFHVCLSFAWLNGDRYTGSITDLLSFTPLHVLFQGREAVHLFFVLSGYTLPALLHRIKPLSWQYLVSRSVRLYVPAWLALGFYMLITFLMSKAEPVEVSFGSSEKILRDFVLVSRIRNPVLVVDSLMATSNVGAIPACFIKLFRCVNDFGRCFEVGTNPIHAHVSNRHDAIS